MCGSARIALAFALAINAAIVGCQRTLSLEPPPLTAEGSVVWVGTRGPGTVELYPAQPATLPDLTLLDNAEIYAIGHRCTPEVLAPSVPAGEVILETNAKHGAPLPSPEEIFVAHFGEGGPTTNWAPLAALPEPVADTLAHLPVTDFNYCRLAAPSFSFSAESVPVEGLVATLFPNALIELGPDDLLVGSGVSYDTFDFQGTSTVAYTLSRIRGGQLVEPPDPTRAPDRIFLTGDGNADAFFLFGRNGLVRGALVDGQVELETVTASVVSPPIYETELVASDPGEAVEHFLVTSAWYLDGPVRTGRELRTFRHFDGQGWDHIERFDVPQVSPSANLSVSRLGPNEAFAIGLDGKEYSVFWWRNGVLERYETKSDDRIFGALTRARRIPGFGIVVGTRSGALLGFDRGNWERIRMPADGTIFDLFAIDGGFLSFVNLRTAAASSGVLSAFTRSTGSCQNIEVTNQQARIAKRLQDGRLAIVDYNTVADTIRYALVTPASPTTSCALP